MKAKGGDGWSTQDTTTVYVVSVFLHFERSTRF